jgi:hypothetical protein
VEGAYASIGEQAKAKREQAARARRWAQTLSPYADRERLLRHAEALEKEASELERQAEAGTTPSRTVVQMQQQPQQQREADPKGADPKDEDREP